MILNSDFQLYHPLWEKADQELIDYHKLFGRLIDLFLIACSIGVKADKSIANDDIENSLGQPKFIGRNTYNSLANADLADTLSFMLENAIINSSTIDFDNEERLKLAFNPDYENKKFSPANFLCGFATYGIVEIYKHINTNLPSQVVADELYEYLQQIMDEDYEALLEGITLEELL